MTKIGRVEVPFGGQNLIIETGKMAKQANGAVFKLYNKVNIESSFNSSLVFVQNCKVFYFALAIFEPPLDFL